MRSLDLLDVEGDSFIEKQNCSSGGKNQTTHEEIAASCPSIYVMSFCMHVDQKKGGSRPNWLTSEARNLTYLRSSL